MRGAITPLPQYAFMALCSVKAQGQLYLFTTTLILLSYVRLERIVLLDILQKLSMYALVPKVSSSPQFFRLTFCTYILSPSCVLHVSPTPFLLDLMALITTCEM
jgi:hypothetical protein